MDENMTVIIDSREKVNDHITDYFDKHNIKHVTKKLDAGDYSVKLTASPEMGLHRELYFPISIEKKNSVDELASSIKDRLRFESEFIRAKGKGVKMCMLVEDKDGYSNIIQGNYRSQYDPKALLASLKTFESRYNFSTAFTDRAYSGNYIYYTLKYYLYEYLKN